MSNTPGARPGDTASYKASGSAINALICVAQDTSAKGLMKLPAAANAVPLGLLTRKVLEGEAGAVVRSGYYWALAYTNAGGTPIVIGDAVIIGDTAGQLGKDPKTTTTTSQVVGYAESAAAADGDEFIVRLQIHERYNV